MKIIFINYFYKNFHINKIKMLYCERIHVSEGIHVNWESALKECNICHYWYF